MTNQPHDLTKTATTAGTIEIFTAYLEQAKQQEEHLIKEYDKCKKYMDELQSRGIAVQANKALCQEMLDKMEVRA